MLATNVFSCMTTENTEHTENFIGRPFGVAPPPLNSSIFLYSGMLVTNVFSCVTTEYTEYTEYTENFL